MLLDSVQKTANFQTQRGQCTKRLLIRHACITWVWPLVGLVSCMLCGYGSTSESYMMQKPTSIFRTVAIYPAILHITKSTFQFMRKKLLFLATAVVLSLSAWAESPKSVHAKHPDKQSYFFKTPNEDKKNIRNFDIERITFDNDNDVVIFKTTQRATEFSKKITHTWTGLENFDAVYEFEDGSRLALTKAFMALYQSSKGGTMWLTMDTDKQFDFEDIK